MPTITAYLQEELQRPFVVPSFVNEKKAEDLRRFQVQINDPSELVQNLNGATVRKSLGSLIQETLSMLYTCKSHIIRVCFYQSASRISSSSSASPSRSSSDSDTPSKSPSDNGSPSRSSSSSASPSRSSSTIALFWSFFSS